VKVGLTLPSFVEDPEIPLRVAREAEAAGVDGVFVYDHLFRLDRAGRQRPAIECLALLGALAEETERITIGTLVVRATLRPPATLAAALDTVERIAGPRLVVGIGSGDEESRPEMEAFGLPMGSIGDRVSALEDAVGTLAGHPYPTWVGGRAAHVGPVAAAYAAGWNRWGLAVDRFASEARRVQEQRDAVGAPGPFTMSWGGLVVIGDDDDEAGSRAARLDAGRGTLVGGPARIGEALADYGAAGAEWVILGPVDATDPGNAVRIGEGVVPGLRGVPAVKPR
jgi:alkanesulfonate monooxygenase SsuD/methylene tetrahydromethanopterin reductase-like flavin-dependent oxidoreductase (luciferase family)